MPLNWQRLIWGAHRLVAGQTQDIRELATKIETLEPASRSGSTPAFYPKGAIDAITSLSPWRNWDMERVLIHGEAINHAATKSYLVENVWVSGEEVFKKAARSRIGYGTTPMLGLAPEMIQLDDAHLVSCFAGSRFFGNFIMDNLPLELLPDSETAQIALKTKIYCHEPGYRALFDLPQPKVVQRARIARLTLYDDFGQNAAKSARYEALRQKIRRSLEGSFFKEPAGVYLKRGATGDRRILTNEAELESFLAGLGFDIVEPAVLTAGEIAQRTLDAPIVVGVEGSHLSHAIYSVADSGAMLVLQPPNRFAMAYKEYADCLGIRFGFVIGKPTDGGFAVDLDQVLELVDRLL